MPLPADPGINPAWRRHSNAPDRKRPRDEGPLAVSLEPTSDILARTRDARRPGALIVGFALETGNAVEKAAAKLVRKGLDLIVVNDALEPGAGFEVDTNRVTLLDRSGVRQPVPFGTKTEVAEAIVTAIEVRLG